MACLESTALSVKELFDQVIIFLTDPINFSGGNQWELKLPTVFKGESIDPDTGEVDPGTREVILMGKGDGKDEIFIGIKIEDSVNKNQQDIVFTGYAGFDKYLEWWEQPGALWHEKLPVIPLSKDVFMNFWLVANTRRFILIVEMGTQYEGGYVGFMKPVNIERQYAYPLVIAGSYIQGGRWASRSAGHSMFTHPGSDTYGGIGGYMTAFPAQSEAENTSPLRLRHPDGTWKTALNVNSASRVMGFEKLCVWPFNTVPTETYTVYRKTGEISKLEDNMMYEAKLYESHPVGNVGVLDGVYYIGNRVDLAAKDTVVYKDKTYKVFSNVFRRNDDSYFAIEWS